MRVKNIDSVPEALSDSTASTTDSFVIENGAEVLTDDMTRSMESNVSDLKEQLEFWDYTQSSTNSDDEFSIIDDGSISGSSSYSLCDKQLQNDRLSRGSSTVSLIPDTAAEPPNTSSAPPASPMPTGPNKPLDPASQQQVPNVPVTNKIKGLKVSKAVNRKKSSLKKFKGKKLASVTESATQTEEDSKKDNRIAFGSTNPSVEYVELTDTNEVSAMQFIHPSNQRLIYIRKQKLGYLFTYDDDDFVARISLGNFNFTKIDFNTQTILNIKRSILRKITILKVLEDHSLDKRNNAFKELKKVFQSQFQNTLDSLDAAEDLFQLYQIYQSTHSYISSDSFDWVIKLILRNNYISVSIKRAVETYCEKENAIKQKFQDFSQSPFYSDSHFKNEILEILLKCMADHEKGIQEKYKSICGLVPTEMKNPLNGLNEKGPLFICRSDVTLYVDLLLLLKEPFWNGLIINSWNSLFEKKVKNICRSPSVKSAAPITQPIYFYLCKSFQELCEEISLITDIPITELYTKNSKGEWGLIENITWPSNSCLNRCLESQFRFIYKLIEHYEPSQFSNTKKFTTLYNLQKSLLNLHSLSKTIENTDEDILMQSIRDMIIAPKNVPQESMIWIHIFDEAIAECPDSTPLEPLIEAYKTFIEGSEPGQYELFRIVTHNTVRFIATTTPYLYEPIDEYDLDKNILDGQLNAIKDAIKSNHINTFRDLIDIFNEFWKLRRVILPNLMSKFTNESFRDDMTAIESLLLKINSEAYTSDVSSYNKELIAFCRSMNEFLEDINQLNFDWYVKLNSELTKTDNDVSLVNEDKNIYKVININAFILTLKEQGQSVPSHYIIDTVFELLCLVSRIFINNWSFHEKLLGSSDLLAAIRKSFIYFKEQPNYECFDVFKAENVSPFESVLNNSENFDDFTRRIEIVGNSFWYLRKQDEIGVHKALTLYLSINIEPMDTNKLEAAYNVYLDQFNRYVQETFLMSDTDKIVYVRDNITKIIRSIKTSDKFTMARVLNTIGLSEGKKIGEWGEGFKKNKLPKILASISAIWSFIASKDISQTGKSLKPHCIQVLCILRLLSVDKACNGVDKHLVEVLTGQGKSIVLGLLSALLALLGYNVRTLCYSSYLADRDENDFCQLFEELQVKNKIHYGTFEEMANGMLEPKVNGKQLSLRQLVSDVIKEGIVKRKGTVKPEYLNNTVLLIDEVDVFFSEKFYGSVYGACTKIKFAALATIQQRIWELSKSKVTSKEDIKNKIYQLIQDENSGKEFEEFRKFLDAPHSYGVLEYTKDSIEKIQVTNSSLFDKHLSRMIDNAMEVSGGIETKWYIKNFRLNKDEIVTYLRNDGICTTSTYHEYYNVFNYFRLKKVEFNHKNYQNYGYFNILCGNVSYAMLPKKYPLILGVSGTINNLNVHEKRVINDTYNINKISKMPSFFGRSNLHFNCLVDFKCEPNENSWLSRIFDSVNAFVSRSRAGLVFFKDENDLNKFKDKYLGKFDRLHILTVNTDNSLKKQFIEEAGVIKTVTLATREMGRGLDFKSSVAVERNGGVHVIQTFASIDIKEETQIRGRTARKNNKGSYEMIVCSDHLKNQNLLADNEEASYALVNNRRLKIAEDYTETNFLSASKNEASHNITMKYFESFFN